MRNALKTIHKIYILLFVVGLSCSTNTEPAKSTKTEPSKQTPTNDPLNGYWILENFQDSALQFKSIAKYRLIRPFWFGYIIQLSNDSVFTDGSFFSESLKRTQNNDSLFAIYFHGSYTAYFNQTENKIFLKEFKDTTKREFNNFYDKPLKYRRLKEDELVLLRESNSLQKNFNAFFTRKIILGDYYNSNSPNKVLSLKDSGVVIGMDGYNKFRIKDYFGTLHNFNNKDVIIFEDTTGVKDIGFYSWRFENDIFILTEMRAVPPELMLFEETKKKIKYWRKK